MLYCLCRIIFYIMLMIPNLCLFKTKLSCGDIPKTLENYSKNFGKLSTNLYWCYQMGLCNHCQFVPSDRQ